MPFRELATVTDALAAFGAERAGSLGAALRACADVERAGGGPCEDTFAHPHIARSLHGSGHAARVAAWSAWLSMLPGEWSTGCTYLTKPLPHGVTADEECQAAVVAAFIHDTGRHNEYVDPAHGDASADLRGRHLMAAIPNRRLAEDSLLAVRLHSRPASDAGPVERRSRAWAILKDADGLDWGRFGPPTSGAGCDIGILRTRVAADIVVAWMAWHLAQLKPSTGWGDAPAAALRDAARREFVPLLADQSAGRAVSALLEQC